MSEAHRQLMRRLLGLAEELGLHVQELGAEVILLRNGHPPGSKGREDLAALQMKMLTLFVEAGQLKAAAKQVVELGSAEPAEAWATNNGRPTEARPAGLLESLHRAGDHSLDGEEEA